ncbi:MAG: hypothetical protein R2786_05895 [Flavobacteriaceae bacterium]
MKAKITSPIPHFFLLLFLLINSIAFSQVGINTVDPRTILDVNGALSLREGGVLTLSNGNNNVNLGATPYSYYRISGPTAAFNIRNITPVTTSNGQMVTLVNTTSQNMTIVNNTGGTAANRIYCPNGANIVLTGIYTSVTLQYNSSLSRWTVVSTNASGGSSSNDWTITGNAGTAASTNFLGTTDAIDLVIRTNNTEKMRVLSNGQVSINDPTPITGDRFTTVGSANEYSINGYSSGANGVGVYGENTTTGIGVYGNVGAGLAVLGTSVGSGWGVTGDNTATGIGVIGFSASTGVGVQGQNSGTGRGVLGFSANTGAGVQGQNSGTGFGLASFNTGTGDGIYNETNNGWGMINFVGGNSIGIYTDLTDAGGVGEYIDLNGEDGTGVFIDNTTASDVYGFNGVINTSTPTGVNVNGTVYAGTQNGVGHGIILTHAGTQGRNAEFDITNASNPDPAIISISIGSGSVVIGQNQSNVLGSAITVADFGYLGVDVDDHIGVSGYSDPGFGYGIGTQGIGGFMGVVGIDNSGLGGGFSYGLFSVGDSGASGTKAFTIDHPNDPENKILKHFSVESNEVLNIYRGTETFDSNGKAMVTLPDYYDAINKNPSYQLTPVGASMPNLFIEKEIAQGSFVIAGGVPGKKVSWMITSERNDPYLQQNPQKREVEISKEDRTGKYLMPQLYGQPKEKGMFYKEQKKYEANTVKPSQEYSLDEKTLPKSEAENKGIDRSKLSKKVAEETNQEK